MSRRSRGETPGAHLQNRHVGHPAEFSVEWVAGLERASGR